MEESPPKKTHPSMSLRDLGHGRWRPEEPPPPPPASGGHGGIGQAAEPELGAQEEHVLRELGEVA